MGEAAIIVAAAVSVGASLKQAQLSKKASKIQQKQIEDEKKWGIKQAGIDKENLALEKEMAAGANLASAASLGYSPHLSGSFLANRNYNQFIFNRTIAQIDEQLKYKNKKYDLAYTSAGIKGQYGYIGGISNAFSSVASAGYKLDSMGTPSNRTTG
tara:strand:- start:2275 stop:2742 length:468 start_codon:yes stop_codon:yes gene_type:complete